MHQLQRQHFARELRPLTAHVRGQPPAVARRLFETILVAWTRANFPSVDCGNFLYVRKSAELPQTISFVNWLSTLDFLEATFWLSSVYALWAGKEHRKKFAMFFTPPSLTTRLLDDLHDSGVSFTESTFVDPACGGAAFIAPIAQRIRHDLKQRGYSDSYVLQHVASHVHGTDIDERLCALSRHFLRIVLQPEIDSTGEQPEFRIAAASSLTDLSSVLGEFDVVVCNPPYRKMKANEVAAAGDEYDEVADAQPNLYGLFIALCVKLLRENGRAALVTPTSFLTGQYFIGLRKYLAAHAQVLRIGMVSERTGIFMDVEQETALTLLCRTMCPVNNLPTVVSLVDRDGSYGRVGSCVLSPSGEAWTIPRVESDVAILAKLSKLPYRIADYGYRVRIGNFVWNRDQRKTYFHAELRRRKARTGIFPLVWSSDVGPDFALRFDDKRTVRVEPHWVDFGKEDRPGIIKRVAVVLQRVTSNDQPRRLVGAVIGEEFLARHRGFVAENHVVVLERITGNFPPEKLVRLLASTPIDRYFRCISGSTNVSAYELRHLPLPDPSHILPLSVAVDFDEQLTDVLNEAPSSDTYAVPIEP